MSVEQPQGVLRVILFLLLFHLAIRYFQETNLFSPCKVEFQSETEGMGWTPGLHSRANTNHH